MATILKREIENGSLGQSWLIRVMIVLAFCVCGAGLVTILGNLNWWEATIIAGAIAIMVLGLLWSIDEVKRLNRD